MKEADGTPIVERWAKLYAKTNNSCSAHIDTGTYKSTAELRMLIEELSLAELRTCRGVWRCFHCDEVFDTPGGLEIAMAERDELKDTVARLAAPVRDAELTPHLLGKKWPIAEAFDALIAARTVPPAQKEQP